MKKFFALPVEVKRKYEIPGLAGQRGYTSFGKEHAKGSTAPDLKEFWQIGQTVEGEDLPLQSYPANISVAELPGFYNSGISLYKAFENTGGQLLELLVFTWALACFTLISTSTTAIPF